MGIGKPDFAQNHFIEKQLQRPAQTSLRDRLIGQGMNGYRPIVAPASCRKIQAGSIRGNRYPVVGRIAMDQFLVDAGDDPVTVGDRVVLWGDRSTGVPSAEEWAAWADSINYEIVTRVGPRVPRVFEG